MRQGSLCIGCIEHAGQSKTECIERHTWSELDKNVVRFVMGIDVRNVGEGFPVPYAPR